MQLKVAEKKRAAWWPAMLSTIAAAHSSLVVGYAYGYTSPALKQLSELPDGYALRLGSISADLFATMVPLGALLFCLLGGTVIDRVGRKKTLLLTGIPNAVGWILIAISPYVTAAGPSVFKVIILTGRFLTGVATSAVCTAVPVYAAEVAKSKQRGFSTIIHSLFISIGLSISYGIGAVTALSYSHSAVVAIGMVFIYAVLAAVIPESPRWLVIKGRDAHALKVLRLLRKSHEHATKEAGEIKKIAENTPKFTLKRQLRRICKEDVYIPAAIFIGLLIVKNLSGPNVLDYYSPIIMEEAGVNNPQAVATYSVGATQFFGTILSAVLVDRVGRKTLLVVGGIGTGIGATLLGTHFYFCHLEEILPFNMSTTINESNTTMNNETGERTTESCNSQFVLLAIFSLVLFSLAFSLGFRCILSILKVEVFPLTVRGILTGLTDSCGWLLIVVSVGSYSNYEQAVGPYTAWWSFAAVSFGGTLFVLMFVPETKGKSLEDIEAMFSSRMTCRNATRKLLKTFKFSCCEAIDHKGTPV